MRLIGTRVRVLVLAGLVVLAVATAIRCWPLQNSGQVQMEASSPFVSLGKTLVAKPVALAPGLYLLGRSTPAAVYVVETSAGLVLIDSGQEASAAAVIDQLRDLHLDVGNLRAILLTHTHADHSLGAQHLRTQTGAKVYAGRGDCSALRAGGPREAFVSVFHQPTLAVHPTTVDVELAGDEKLDFGDARFIAIAAPGHTPGSMCYWMERADLRALFTGDVVLHFGLATTRALGTYPVYLPPLYRGNARDFLDTLRRLRDLPMPDLILPGHPQMDPVPQDPHLKRMRWLALLDEGIADLQRLLKRYEADGQNFLDGHPKQLLSGMYYLGDFGGLAVYCLEMPEGLILFNAPGDNMLVDFLTQRFDKLGWHDRKIATILLTSADGEATGGLPAVVQRFGCIVVAPKAGLDAIRHLCPVGTKLLIAEEFEKTGRIPIRVFSLAGRGRAPVAYELRCAGKTVLISGRIPVMPSAMSAEKLERELKAPGHNEAHYLQALERLAEVNPDLWLPAKPAHGQNANLYDEDWARVLLQNKQMFRQVEKTYP